MSYFLQPQWDVIDRMITENEKSEENKTLPLGFTKFNARDAKNIVIPVYKPKSK